MNKSIAVIATAGVLVSGVALAGPAQAYDREAYSYAAAHMIEHSDIPASLGAFKKSLGFNAFATTGRTFVCDVPQANPADPDVAVFIPGGKYTFSANYMGKGKTDSPSLSVTVNQYANAMAAIKAYDALKKNIKKCTGTGSSTWTNPDDGTTSTYSTELTNGVVPQVSTLGVESLFVSSNSLQVTTPGDSKFLNDQYSVFSLIDDVVVQTTYWSNANTNLTTKQRKDVDRVAFNAETRWLD